MRSSAVLSPKPGNQLWGIYHTDREYAREHGGPTRTVIEAPTAPWTAQQVIVLNERQPRQILGSYFVYYHEVRPHRSLSS